MTSAPASTSIQAMRTARRRQGDLRRGHDLGADAVPRYAGTRYSPCSPSPSSRVVCRGTRRRGARGTRPTPNSGPPVSGTLNDEGQGRLSLNKVTSSRPPASLTRILMISCSTPLPWYGSSTMTSNSTLCARPMRQERSEADNLPSCLARDPLCRGCEDPLQLGSGLRSRAQPARAKSASREEVSTGELISNSSMVGHATRLAQASQGDHSPSEPRGSGPLDETDALLRAEGEIRDLPHRQVVTSPSTSSTTSHS